MTDERALVLGGGGVAGIAWTTGVLAGLADAGCDVTDADVVIGSSAGATVAAQATSGIPLGELLRRQVDPAAQNKELVPSGDSGTKVLETMFGLAQEIEDRAELRRRIGELALAAETVPEAERRKVIEDRLPVHEWPDRRLVITAVAALSGTPSVFDRESGVQLVDAVTASCAVPGVWPPVTIGETRFVDGSVRSISNADLASGNARVVVIAPVADPGLGAEVAQLVEEGSRVEVVTPDEASVAAFGPDPLDPTTRTPAAKAGYAQGREAAAVVAAVWRSS
ncbi:patatin-like phospholipase family protein [Actinomadura hibisca]|uniref:patatin-like phospholipase family protein n=1 Tax=Actinomadura hibisca TaxID=68565 RepID=UPI000834E14E|nr:patatin-like phospholipase family protein [Actinomadura hibisca]